jgi:hypothetical protein
MCMDAVLVSARLLGQNVWLSLLVAASSLRVSTTPVQLCSLRAFVPLACSGTAATVSVAKDTCVPVLTALLPLCVQGHTGAAAEPAAAAGPLPVPGAAAKDLQQQQHQLGSWAVVRAGSPCLPASVVMCRLG